MAELGGLGLLPRKLDQLTKQMDEVKSQVAEFHAAASSQKADVVDLRESFESLHASVQEAWQAEAKRLDSLEESVRKLIWIDSSRHPCSPRSRSGPREPAPIGYSALHKRIEKLEALSASSPSKQAEGLSEAQLSEKISSFLTDEQFVERISADSIEKVSGQMKALIADLEARWDQRYLNAQDAMAAQIAKSLASHIGQSYDSASACEQLNVQFRSLSTALSHKAELSEVEQIRMQLRALNRSVAQQAEEHTAEVEKLSAKLKDPVYKPHVPVDIFCTHQELEQLRDSLSGKADTSRVEGLQQQLATMSDIVAQRLANPVRRPSGGPRRPQPPFSQSGSMAGCAGISKLGR